MNSLDRVLAIIRTVDEWLDAEVSAGYQGQPLAQDWARVAKVAEETGEAVDALVGCTGQNPRKGHYGDVDDLLGELADVAMTAMFAIQHFTKDETRTGAVIMAALEKAATRAAEAGYETKPGAGKADPEPWIYETPPRASCNADNCVNGPARHPWDATCWPRDED